MEDFVNYEIANKLKNLGFEESTYHYYNIDDIRYCRDDYPSDHNGDPLREFEISAPTISQVLKWLREEKKLYVGVTYSPKIEGSQDFYYATIQYIGDYKKTIYPNDSYDNWEGAALNGIEYVIDNNLIL